jgi:D-glycero-D-manno-heptose 1,7-bisphosphate phosphatase
VIQTNYSDSPRLVVLDFDGVINHRATVAPASGDNWSPIPGSLEAIARLNHAGFTVVVASSEPSVGDGLLSITELNAVHAKFQHALARVGGHVEGIFFCPHAADSDCACRAPRPGLLEAIAQRCSVPIEGIPVIVDSTRQAEAALAVSAHPILVMTGLGRQSLKDSPAMRDLPGFEDLATAACYVLDPSAFPDSPVA